MGDPEDYVTVEDAAKMLGVGRNDMYRIPVRRWKISRWQCYKQGELDKWADGKPRLLLELQQKKQAAEIRRQKRDCPYTESRTLKKRFRPKDSMCPKCGVKLVAKRVKVEPVAPAVGSIAIDAPVPVPDEVGSLLLPPEYYAREMAEMEALDAALIEFEAGKAVNGDFLQDVLPAASDVLIRLEDIGCGIYSTLVRVKGSRRLTRTVTLDRDLERRKLELQGMVDVPEDHGYDTALRLCCPKCGYRQPERGFPDDHDDDDLPQETLDDIRPGVRRDSKNRLRQTDGLGWIDDDLRQRTSTMFDRDGNVFNLPKNPKNEDD